MEKNDSAADSFMGSLFECVLMSAGFGILSALGVLGYQIYWYLRLGEWYTLSIISGLRRLHVQWAFHPNEWFGVYKIRHVSGPS